MDKYLQIVDDADQSESWMVEFAADQPPALHLTSPLGDVLTGSGEDWFDALQQVRRQLEQRSLRAACVGARTNAYPSGMLRDMSLGLTVYLLQPGKAAWRRAYIFDPADVAHCGTVADQDAFYAQWLKSPKKKTLSGRIAGLDIVATWSARRKRRQASQ